MQRLATVVLRHADRFGVHYDWLLAPPCEVDAPDHSAPLWTARAATPSWTWTEQGVWPLQRIGAHRRAYLSYQGSISGNRGWVTRIDQGWFSPWLWTAQRILADVHLTHCRGRIELALLANDRWRAKWLHAENAGPFNRVELS